MLFTHRLGQMGRRFSGGGGGGGSGSSTTWSPTDIVAAGGSGALSGGNLTVTLDGSNPSLVRATAGATASRRYCEITVGSGTGSVSDTYFGLHRADGSHSSSAFSILNQGDGTAFTGGSSGCTYVSGSTSYTTGDVLMLAVDTTSGTASSRKAWLGKNGTWFNGDPAAGTGGSWHSLSDAVSWRPYVYKGNAGSWVFTLNVGGTAFTYSPPSGFSAF
jgi:hypothetical protein